MTKQFALFCFVLILACNPIISSELTNFNEPVRFPFQDSAKAYNYRSQTILVNNELWLFYIQPAFNEDTLYFSRTSDNGQSWQQPEFISKLDKPQGSSVSFSAIKTRLDRIIVVFMSDSLPPGSAAKYFYSDDNGLSWSTPQNVFSSATILNPKIVESIDGNLWILGRHTHLFYSTNNGSNWLSRSLGFNLPLGTKFDLISTEDSTYFLFYDLFDAFTKRSKIYFRKSTDEAASWSDQILITEENVSEQRPSVYLGSENSLNLITQFKQETSFPDIFQDDIVIKTSTNNGASWGAPVKFTNYSGFDGEQNIYYSDNTAYISFLSDRWYGRKQVWVGQLGLTQDTVNPPVLFKFETSNLIPNEFITIRAYAGGQAGISNVELVYYLNDSLITSANMFDDGNHNDFLAGDNIWGISIGPFSFYDNIKYSFNITDNNNVSILFDGASLLYPTQPVQNKWLSSGSLHNWYSSIGSEIEEGFQTSQQYGLRWPAISDLQDMQCSKGFWIGAKNFTDENGRFFPYKVNHVGPRAEGSYVFYPKEFKLVGKFDNPLVTVNGVDATREISEIDEINPSLASDRMIYNILNTQLGITVERKIYQFSQEYHDNYIISEYTFTNTGNTDYDNTIELPGETLTDVYFYFLYRWAINRYTRYAIGNATGWGANTMLDTRGDGVINDPPGENVRAQYSWHGYFPQKTVSYDNIGAPLWAWSSATGTAPGDTIGRLSAPQFAGVVTLHADKSSIDNSDDPIQPSTTSWEGSDDSQTRTNDPFNDQKMEAEYQWMSKGHKSPRHANQVEPLGNFSEPTGNPSLGTSGGFSATNGYGPYTLAPGEKVKIIWAEAVNGINRETAIDAGRQYKSGQISAKQKNEIVLTGKDSLFNSFRKIISNFNNGNGFIIPQPPFPPDRFEVTAGEDQVLLKWHHNKQGPNITGFEIYRAPGGYDSVYTLIYSSGLPSDSSFIDLTIERGNNYYYYIQAVGVPSDNNGAGMTPFGALKSSRYYTQTYEPVSSTITSIIDDSYTINDYRLYQNYPNPFNPITTIKYNIKDHGLVTLKVYNLLGEKVADLVNEIKGSGNYEVKFDASYLSSGIYFYKLQVNNFIDTKKLLLLK